MDFRFNEEQEEFRSSLRRFLQERAPLSAVREWVRTDRGYDEKVWQQLSEQLGLPSLHVPEEYGGAGYGLLEAAVAAEELGRALAPVPYLSTALAAQAVLLLGTEDQKKELLPQIASGEAVAALAVYEPGGAADAVTTRAHARGSEYVLEGVKAPVPDGHAADILLVAARSPEGSGEDVELFVVRGDAPGVRRERVDALDLTRAMARVELSDVAATRLGEAGDTAVARRRLDDIGRMLLSFEMVGGTERCLEMSVQYAKDRHQFNRPIGSFQAIKHKCAEMAVELDCARSAAYFAAFTASEGSDELATAAPLAKAQCADAYAFAAGWNIQVHGGIGFTWEHDAHLYFRRAKSDELLFGTSSQNRALLADRVGI